MNSFLSQNLEYLGPQNKDRILSAPDIGIIQKAKSGKSTISIDGIYFHSRHDPGKEAKRFAEELKSPDEEKIY
ncbi:MAG: hypothetical protein K8R21_10540, partial [Leptospira sp.]|nr:hypothetical protein [Leptospira sp.]